ncbi:rhodanese-like domain-containing protein 11, chloroplastic isoform X2 [Phoenix dactylifera]|uniref:Rhodanese-like domain-containing protein 11, chloroplastic isoform X2 n=1 Tax=Phoenix dactylifera TaxID=42345 RepID=A0A8B8J650_PHODC|nr:rhodanese-like domain-containing protein 11, chloroplastic isoform X2 [Phoenix dactylifera]XP_038989766.1 rhodanese-like domain-containing protein 11, chloroplastic isoform X2 [Phoenix dactylifera]
MEAFGRTLTTTLAISPSAPWRQRAGHRGRSSLLSIPRPRSPNFGGRSRAAVRMGASVGGEEEEARQAKEMVAARRRWEALIREQKIKVLTPREAGYAIQLSNKTLLDVRPSTEHNKAWVKGSTWIPIFDVDSSVDMQTLAKKITNFVMGGWWSGSPMLAFDKGFIGKVEEKFPKDSDIIVACQKGLSWTDQQRAIAAKEGWAYRLVFTGRLVGLILIADALLLGAQKLGPLLQELRSH